MLNTAGPTNHQKAVRRRAACWKRLGQGRLHAATHTTRFPQCICRRDAASQYWTRVNGGKSRQKQSIYELKTQVTGSAAGLASTIKTL
ncbi:hypothetical protein QQF64_001716 [Cirrhinus molitorella]|uniref:Uncharacterized protein n=1 Tax=Cirrhinus molitorella TaxID=172907 RepID=A0ABR3P0W0_9TELE